MLVSFPCPGEICKRLKHEEAKINNKTKQNKKKPTHTYTDTQFTARKKNTFERRLREIKKGIVNFLIPQ